jgi:hypothetical protein
MFKERDTFIWIGENWMCDFNFQHDNSDRLEHELSCDNLLFLIYVEDIEVARINFNLTLVPPGATVDTPSYSFSPTFTRSVLAFYAPEDKLEYLRWRLALKCSNPNLTFLSTGKSEEIMPDQVIIFWSFHSVSAFSSWKNELSKFLEDKKLVSEFRVSVIALDPTPCKETLKPFIVGKQQYFKRFTIESNPELQSFINLDLKSIGSSLKDTITDSAHIQLGKEIGSGFFGSAHLAIYKWETCGSQEDIDCKVECQ